MMLAHFHADTGVPKGREVREGGGGFNPRWILGFFNCVFAQKYRHTPAIKPWIFYRKTLCTNFTFSFGFWWRGFASEPRWGTSVPDMPWKTGIEWKGH